MRKTTTMISLALGMAATTAMAEMRTWTSATDASKQFKAELTAASTEKITVVREDGTEMTFPLSVVSAADQAYVKENASKLAPPAENKVYKELASNMGRGTVSGGAHYYILYAAASF